MICSHLRIIRWVEACDHVIKYANSIWFHFTVISDALKPEPDSVSAVVACTLAAAQQVRYEAMTQTAAVRQNQNPRFVKTSRYQH